jgi:hypothetical protein
MLILLLFGEAGHVVHVSILLRRCPYHVPQLREHDTLDRRRVVHMWHCQWPVIVGVRCLSGACEYV